MIPAGNSDSPAPGAKAAPQPSLTVRRTPSVTTPPVATDRRIFTRRLLADSERTGHADYLIGAAGMDEEVRDPD
jgi:hypothetical protein